MPRTGPNPARGGTNAVFRNRERKARPSRPSRPATPGHVDGLSTRLAAIPATEGCCPVVVGIWNGSGVAAQTHTRHVTPPMQTAAAP